MHGLPDYYNISNINSETIEIIWNDIIKKMYVNFEVPSDLNYYIDSNKVFAVMNSLKCEGKIINKGTITIYS